MITKQMKDTLNEIAELIISDLNLQMVEVTEETDLVINTLGSHGFKDVAYQDIECSSTGDYTSMTLTGMFKDKELIIELSTNEHDVFMKFLDLQDILDNQPEIPLSHKLQVIMLKSLVEFL